MTKTPRTQNSDTQFSGQPQPGACRPRELTTVELDAVKGGYDWRPCRPRVLRP